MVPGAGTAAVLYVVMGLRYLCATWLLSKPLRTKLACLCVFEIAFLFSLYYTWTGLPSFLSWLATALLTYCAFFLTGYSLRKWLYLIGGIWLVHSALVGSWPHMAASIIQLTINHFVAMKLRKELILGQESLAFRHSK